MAASAAIPALDYVDVSNTLSEIEAGDVLHVRFSKDSIDDVTYLIGMIQDGIFTSPDEVVLMAIALVHDWDGDENRTVTLIVTKQFDGNTRIWFFSRRMWGHFEELEVVSRNRPLVDVSLLNEPDASIRIRFKPGGVDGVDELLDLEEMGLLELGSAETLREAKEAGEWFGCDRGRHLTNKMAGDENKEYREHFIEHVVPHLDLMRS